MNQYHKINGVFKRDEKGNFIMGDWACPEFEYLQDYEWDWYEKVDGTNVRVIWDGEGIQFKGKTDKAVIPDDLLTELHKMFHGKLWWLKDNFDEEHPICLYGEGYGEKIQSGGDYGPASFILFDVKIGGVWLKREDVEDIAEKLGIKCVPKYGTGLTLNQAIGHTNGGWLSYLKDGLAEGAIGIPKGGMLDRMGRRIIVKLKHVDLK